MPFATTMIFRLMAKLSQALPELSIGLYALFWQSLAVAAADILVLQSHDSTPYQQVLSGFQRSLDQLGLAVNYSTQVMDDSGSGSVEQLLKQHQPKLIFSLGTPATRVAIGAKPSIPIVTGLTLGSTTQPPPDNTTGISLDFPAATQWLWLRRLLPEARRVAIIYDPRHGEALFQTLRQQAQVEDIDLIAAPAQAEEDLPSLLQRLPSQLDALWALDGVVAFNAMTVRELLLYSFRNRTPLIGLSEQWVKAGALYALDWDYADLGSQAADLAWKILAKGKMPGELPMQTPRIVRPVFNSNTAEYMKLTFPQHWLPEMTEVKQ